MKGYNADLSVDNHQYPVGLVLQSLPVGRFELHLPPDALQKVLGQDHNDPLGVLHTSDDLICYELPWHPVTVVQTHFVGWVTLL